MAPTMASFVRGAAILAAGFIASRAQTPSPGAAICDADQNFATYDLKSLCQLGGPFYNWTDPTWPASGLSLTFQLCGTANIECIPPYNVLFNRATAVQWLNWNGNAGESCIDVGGVIRPCTGDCEILGEGPPIMSLLDPNDPYGGVTVTYFGVPSNNTLHPEWNCPMDKRTGGPADRIIRINIACSYDIDGPPLLTGASETNTCEYQVNMSSIWGCGCDPQCYGSNCGPDGCGGYCGGTGTMGACPVGQSCLADTGVCCKPDCANRQCGDDGCGGSCGTCLGSLVCSRYQQCMVANPTPSPSQLVEIRTVETSADPADIAAGFFGGVFATGAAATFFTLYKRARFGGAGYARAT